MTRMHAIAPFEMTRQERTQPRAAPLLPAAVGLAVGVAIDNAWAPPLWVYVVTAVAALIGLFIPQLRRRWAWLIAATAAACLGGIRHDDFYRRVSPDHVVRFVPDEPVLARITGTVITTPQPQRSRTHAFARWSFQYRRTRFLLKALSIEGRAGPILTGGLIAVAVDESVPRVHAGDRVSAYGALYRPREPSNPGQFNYARWQRRQGVLVSMRCRGADLVVTEKRAADPVRAVFERFRTLARRVLLDDELAFGQEQRNLIDTLVLGRRYAIDSETEERFIRTGTAHFLAVSGAHVGIVAWLAWALVRRTGGTRRRAAVWVIAVIVTFACLVDPRPPVFRAAIIGVLYCLGLLLRRSAQGVNSTALAAIILLCLRPTMLFGPGFQMSFAGVLSIICLHQPLLRLWRRLLERRHPRDEPLRVEAHDRSVAAQLVSPLYRRIRSVTVVSMAAWLATAPIAWLHFGRMAPLGWLSSVLLFPFFAATLILGVSTMAVGFLLPAVLPWLKGLMAVSTGWLLWGVETLEGMTWTVRGWGGSVTSIGCVVVILLVVHADSAGIEGGWRSWGKKHMRYAVERMRRPRWVPAASLLPVAILIPLVATARHRDQQGALRVTWLAVGGGSATVIEWPDGRVWLYDCGSKAAYDVGENTILPFCRRRGIRRIDRIIISHPNIDHFSGILSVIDGLPCGPVTVNRHFERVSPPDGAARMMLIELQRRGHVVEVADGAAGWPVADDASVEVLWPPEELPGGVTTNDTSTVIRVSCRGRSILLTGDIEAYAIGELLRRGGLAADVLVLPHHGGVERNTAEFLAAIDPRVCMRSSYRRADQTSQELLEAVGERVHFNTADDGAVTLVIDETGLTVSGYRTGPGSAFRIPDAALETDATIRR